MKLSRIHHAYRASRLVALLLGLLMVSVPVCWAAGSNPDGPDQKSAARADRLYDEGRFDSAYKTYLQLARKGDPFSQYRVSYMNLHGEGVPKDLVQAYAWADLAAESGNPQLVKYRDEVKATLPSDQLDAAEDAALDYSHEWGKVALAIAATNKSKRIMRDCTGSRLGARCDEVYAAEMPSFWNVRPGAGNGADGGGAAPGGSVSSAGTGAGGATRDGRYYSDLKEYTVALEQYISRNTGHVELGEFRVIEPEASETAAEPAAQESAKEPQPQPN